MFRLVVFVFWSSVFFYGESAHISKGTERIVNGDEADTLDFPYQCSLQKLENHACGCSIYNNKVVVTAAHCLVGATQSDINHMQVRAGSVFWGTGGVLRKVASIVLHPDYDTNTMANDVALIKLSSPLDFNSTIKPIKLATSNPADGSPVEVSGWGYESENVRVMTPKLRKVTVKYISGKVCSSSRYKYLEEIKIGMVCAVEGDKDACQGDSGGPLRNSATGELIGIVSWGYGCAKNGYPGIYSDVVYFRAWITKIADSL